METYPDDRELIDEMATKIIWYIVITMLYYDLSVDPTMLQSINEIYRVK